MPRIAYTITHHGFGHFTRTLAILEALAGQIPNLELILVSQFPDWFRHELPPTVPVTLIPFAIDPGPAHLSQLGLDLPRTIQQFQARYQDPYSQLAPLVRQIAPLQPEMVITDMAPLGLALAEELGVPGILVSNFTWVDILQPFLAENPALKEVLSQLEQLYAKASFQYALEPGFPSLLPHTLIPPIARRCRCLPQIKKDFGITGKLILYSFGGFSDHFALPPLDPNSGLTLLIPTRGQPARLEGSYLFYPIDQGVYHQDLMTLSDGVVTKLGYGTLGEALQAHIPIAYLSRDDFAESPILEAYVKKHLPSLRLTQEELQRGRWYPFFQNPPLAPAPTPKTFGQDLLAVHFVKNLLPKWCKSSN